MFRAEVLWAHGIDPKRPGRSLSEEELLAMWAWLRDGAEARRRGRGRIAPHDGGRGAYHQEGCVRCGGVLVPIDGRRPPDRRLPDLPDLASTP